MRRLLLVVNPSASSFTGALLREVRAILGDHFEVSTEWPDGPDESRRAAADAAKEGVDVVAAMGGDGVVHHVANGLVGSPTALGVIPAGTTNVFARIMKISTRPRKAAESLTRWPPRKTVVAEISLDGSPRASFGTFAVGAGFDAEVIEVAERRPTSKVHFGGVYYARTTVRVLWERFRDRPATLRALAHGRRADGVAVVVQVHGPYSYFGRLPLWIGPSRHDGFSVLTIGKLDLVTAASLVPRLLRNRVRTTADLERWAGVAELTITADPPAPVQADGEQLGLASTIVIRPSPKPLLVLAPARTGIGKVRR